MNREANYRESAQPNKRVFYVDVSEVAPKDIPAFMAGVRAAMKAMEDGKPHGR